MPVLQKVNQAQVPSAPAHPIVADNWQFILSDKGRDTTFINYLVGALQPTIGVVYPDTYVRAPGMRFHPIYHKEMMHTGWDVTFKDPKEFTIEQLLDRLAQAFEVEDHQTGFTERAGNFIKLDLTPRFIKNASLWSVTLCHFKREGSIWIQGSTGASTSEHVHIGIRAHGQVV